MSRCQGKKIRVLFVCLGNICRSPLAEGVFRKIVRERGLEDCFEIDSAGTGPWHVGEPPDRRMQATANKHGVSLEGIRGRQISVKDLETYDYIFVMDKHNLHDVLYLDPEGKWGHKVQLFRVFDPEPGDYQVPDPYYGGPQGFEHVYEVVERTAQALLDRLIEKHDLTAAVDGSSGS